MSFKEMEMSHSVYPNRQSPITESIVHYRNVFANPEHYIKRKINYSKMMIYDEKYRKELERLVSMDHLEIPYIFKMRIAKAGFFFKEASSIKNQVRCIYCQGLLGDWKLNDSPIKRHKVSYPTCPFVLNLNVGNLPLENDRCRLSVKDPDARNLPSLVRIPRTHALLPFQIQNKIDFLDLDVRESTFRSHPHLKHFAYQGLLIFKRNVDSVFCCITCRQETEILKGVEDLPRHVFHKKYCHFKNIETMVLKDIDCPSGTRKEFCQVEYRIAKEELDARMDTNRVIQLITDAKLDSEKLKSVIENRLKRCGKDFDSLFELIVAYDNYNVEDDTKRWTREDFGFDEFHCVVCLDEQVQVIFLPCGHLKTCDPCSKGMVSCPVCRKLIERRVTGFRLNTGQGDESMIQ